MNESVEPGNEVLEGEIPGGPLSTVSISDREAVNPASEKEWFWAEGIKGEGDPPDWYLKDKYKFVADQAKSYPEAQKRLGGFSGAPEEYTININEELAKHGSISADDPVLQEFNKLAKDANMNQQTYDQMLNLYLSNSVDANLENNPELLSGS